MRYNAVSRWLGLSLLFLTVCLMMSGPAWAQARKEIVVGTPISMTGMLAMDGQEQLWAYQQAVADLNKKGGIFVKEFGKKLPVKLVAADDESDPGKGVAAMEKLIRVDKVDLFLSGHSTPLTVPQNITADKYKIYYHGTMCILPIWRERKFQWSTIFTFDLDQATDLPYQLWDSLPPSDRIQRPALLMEDSLDGRGFADFFRPHAAKHNYKFVVDEPWAIGAKDYSSQILKFRANNVDAILIFGSNTDCITLVRQMKESGVSAKYLHGWKGTWGSEFWAALGKDAQYVLTDGHWSEYFPYPGAKELGERFTKKFNKQSVSVGMYYALCQVLWKAIENAGTLDSAKVKQAVVNHEFKATVMGDVKYLPDGSAVYLSTANQWWDGKQRLVFPVIKGGWKFKLAPPWEKR